MQYEIETAYHLIIIKGFKSSYLRDKKGRFEKEMKILYNE